MGYLVGMRELNPQGVTALGVLSCAEVVEVYRYGVNLWEVDDPESLRSGLVPALGALVLPR